MKNVLDQEIKWCRANRGKSGKGKAFEDGFIAGLKQAKFLCAAQRQYVGKPKQRSLYAEKNTTQTLKRLANA